MKLTQNEKKILYYLIKNEIDTMEFHRDEYGDKDGKDIRILKNIIKKIEKEEVE